MARYLFDRSLLRDSSVTIEAFQDSYAAWVAHTADKSFYLLSISLT